ncbi:hypothetical protein HZS_7585 [Henneguya salminicola]|nr:hypothetical protein HZS_7585 [Henneguya salminicola]
MESVINKLSRFNLLASSDNEKEFKRCLENEKSHVLNLFNICPIKFIQKYSNTLDSRDLCIIEMISDNSDVLELIKKLKVRIKQIHGNDIKIDVRNRRYFYIVKCLKENDYFSLEQIKDRYPLLFDQYLGRLQILQDMPSSINSFSQFLLNHIQNIEFKQKLFQARHEENSYLHVSEYDLIDNMNIDPSHPQQNLDFLTKELYSEIFFQFITGQDPCFDYEQIDNNLALDNLHYVSSTSQDDYFDSETPETISD